jgi:hypothetical protein
MDNEVFSDSRVKSLIAKSFVPVRIDSAQNSQLFDQYGVQYIPTLVVLDKDGHELYRCNYQTADQLLATLNQYAAK